MVQNRSRKTVRHFQCRDDLWALYEKMAAELECSVDYLINEAMRQYARSRRNQTIPPTRESIAPPPMRSSGAAPPAPRPSGGGIAPPPSGQRLAPPPTRPSGPGAGGYSQPPQRPPQPAFQSGQAPQAQSTPPPQPQPLATTQPVPIQDTDPLGQRATIASPQAQQAPQPPQQQQQFQVAQPAAQPPIPASAGTMPTLYLIFNGQKIPITKEQFIIGRGLKTSDLAIKDGNISRKHAAIIYHNGAYYIKDLGSVNGVEYQSKRIDSKRIDEADEFTICDYRLQFTYQ